MILLIYFKQHVSRPSASRLLRCITYLASSELSSAVACTNDECINFLQMRRQCVIICCIMGSLQQLHSMLKSTVVLHENIWLAGLVRTHIHSHMTQAIGGARKLLL